MLKKLKALTLTAIILGIVYLNIPLVLAQSQNGSEGTPDDTKAGLSAFFDSIQTKLPQIFVALIVFFASFIVARIARAAAQRAVIKSGRHEGALSIVGKSAYIGSLVLGLVIALNIVNVDISFIVAAIGFGLGFAMKDILQNYISGVIILLQEPFKIGDIVRTGDFLGRIEDIEARTTSIRIFDGQRVILSNSDMVTLPLTNYSTYPERRINVEFGVSFDTDLRQAIEVVIASLKGMKGSLKEPEPQVIFTGFGKSSIRMVGRFWINSTVTNWLQINSQAVQEIKMAFDKEGINIPFPITTLSVNAFDSDDFYPIFGKTNPKDK